MTTEYKKALDDMRDNSDWVDENWETIRRALMIADAVESGDAKLHPQGSDRPQGEIEAWNKAIEHLKNIGAGE